MQLGMIGLGRMGANMVRRLQRNGHSCVVYDRNSKAIAEVTADGAQGSASLADFVKQLSKPRAIWLMVPAAVVDASINDLVPLLDKDDILIDGGNSHYVDDIRRAKALTAKGIHYVDVGTSGGVWGLERGYCMMIGGEPAIAKHLDPLFVDTRARASATFLEHRAVPRPKAPPRRATCIAGPMAPATSSRWSTTALSTA